MNKYIPAEKLKYEIERWICNIENCPFIEAEFGASEKREGKLFAYKKLLSLITSLQQEQQEKTCKTCGFYENNCPFIRGKMIPYPNKVCKDYIYSVMKEQEQPYAIGGVVHHALGTHWVVTNQEQLCARLKQFPEGAEVEILIEARKEE